MLNEFRSIDITWDKANKRIYDNVKTVSSDEQGRKLIVQVLNGNQIEDLTGASLNLYWETKSKHYRGLDLFDVIDAKKGLFELYFTTGMLSNIGQLNAHLHLIDGTGAVTSELFKIRVLRGVNTDTVESSNSFSALTEALAGVVAIELQETERQTNEQDRTQAETSRNQAEQVRSTEEDKRISNEAVRESAENAREDNESNRASTEDTRKTNETTRENAENTRESNEDIRESNEQTRIENENNRVQNAQELEETYAPRLTEVEQKTNDEVYTVDNNVVDFKNEVTQNGSPWGVESGSNNRGHWKKHPNGVLECWGKVNVSTGSGGFFALNLPQFFIDDKAYVNCGPLGYTYRDLVINSYITGGGVVMECYVYSVGGTSKPNIEVPVQFYAIGRWK